MQLHSTNDLDIFIFQDSNRKNINKAHVDRLVKSINENNMLNVRPIIVDKDLNIIDGQHRVLAARQLGLEVFYYIIDSESKDIIRLNQSLPWSLADYLNFYVKQGHEEYIKINKFLIQQRLEIRTALRIVIGYGKLTDNNFKSGYFKCPDLDILNKNRNTFYNFRDMYVEKRGGSGQDLSWIDSIKLWKAFVRLISHEEFNEQNFMNNLEKNIYKVGPKGTEEDYHKMFLSIYNYRKIKRLTSFVDQEES